jgi:HD-GYP domain-containing protein (c-di-GMP phosphodiesterase class II)
MEIIKALGTAEERILQRSGPGNFLGEMSMFDPDGRRTATAQAQTAATLLEMSLSSFQKLLHQQPDLAFEVTRQLSLRLRNSDNAIIHELQEKNRQLAAAYAELQVANRNLEAAKEELEIAYEATLKGWVRALDLRDKETKGHTQRVTALTRVLAKAMGFEGESLIHVTRGALLHDIGKMGIPDNILLKPGALTAEEREHIQQHPLLAFEMLSPIQFLHPAIDIPYCHHEKWDGTGYPRGLKGAEIPLIARIFSIIDVWDALVSDRPYRKAMEPAEVQVYLRQQSGTAFDPKIVDLFLGIENLPAALGSEQEQFSS